MAPMTAYLPCCYYGTGHGSAEYRGSHGTLCFPCYRAARALSGETQRQQHAASAIHRLQNFMRTRGEVEVVGDVGDLTCVRWMLP